MHTRFLGKWILLFFLLGFSLFMSLKTPFVSFWLFFWALLPVVALSFIWLAVGYYTSRLSLERLMAKRVDEDEWLEITATITHKSRMPLFDIALEDYLNCTYPAEKQKIIILDHLKANSKAKVIYRCFCYQRGRYEIGPFTVYFFDPLGLFYLKRTYRVFSGLYVYPRRFPIHKFPALNKGPSPWFNIETCRVSGDDDEFYGVREYRRGDPLKRIHWMATARKGQLIVKEFQRQNFFRATLLFNLQKEQNLGLGKECVAEYTIKIVASIATYLINAGVSVELISHAGEIVHIPFNKGADHLESILKFLTVAQAESRIDLSELFETFYRELSEDSSLIVVMTDKDKVYLPRMFSLGVRNVALIPIILISSSFLQNDQQDKDMKDYDLGVSENARLNPIYIACQENLEEKF